VADASGWKMGEKGLRLPYSGIEVDLEDWAPVHFLDAFNLTLRMVCTPQALASVVMGAVTERGRKNDAFGTHGFGRVQDLGGSPRFHLMNPLARRALVGFPDPEKYLRINLDRRRGIASPSAVHFPDPAWKWLTTIEPVASISLRSLHMLVFACERARLANRSEVSLFVGEIHNTDIEWYTTALQENGIVGNWDERDLAIINGVRREAISMAQAAHVGDAMIFRRIPYLGLGAAPLAAAAAAAAAAAVIAL